NPRIRLPNSNVATDYESVEVLSQRKAFPQFAGPFGNVIGQAPDGVKLRADLTQEIEQAVRKLVSEQIVVFERRNDFDALPEFARRKVTEARRTVDCLDFGIVGQSAVFMDERTQEFTNIISYLVNDAHRI